MFGTKTQMSPTAGRKELLLLECELNRAQLNLEWDRLGRETRELRTRAGAAAVSLVALVIMGGAGVATARALRAKDSPAKNAWLPAILNGFRLFMMARNLFHR